MPAHPISLLIDIGNTRIKLGWVNTCTGEREPRTMAILPGQTSAIATLLEQLPSLPRQVWAVSVAKPQINDGLVLQLQNLLGTPIHVHWVRSSKQALGVQNNYQPVNQLGADRWVAMLGLAWHLRQQHNSPHNAILASFGTATTIDTLHSPPPSQGASPAHTFKGGLILPGLNLMRASLANGTAGLPVAEGSPVLHPRHTHQAIASGLAAAQTGALVHQYLGLLHETGQAPAVFVTGGAWPALQAHVEQAFLQLQQQLRQPCAPPAPHWLASPILDGLAQLAQQP